MIANGGRSGRWIVRGLVAQGVVKFPDWPDELERDDEEFKLCGNSRTPTASLGFSASGTSQSGSLGRER